MCECVCIPVCKVYVHACVFMHTCMCVKEVCLNLGTKEPQRSHNEERERETETESSCSQEPKLGTTERGHHNDGWQLWALLPACRKDFCRVQSGAGSRKGLWMRQWLRLMLPVSASIHMLKDHMHVKGPVLHEWKQPKTGAVWSPNLFFITL